MSKLFTFPHPYQELFDSYGKVFEDSTDESYKVSFNIAGTPKEAISLYVEDDFIKVDAGKKNLHYVYIDSSLYDMEKSTAEYENGILSVILPKAPPNTRKIEIK